MYYEIYMLRQIFVKLEGPKEKYNYINDTLGGKK